MLNVALFDVPIVEENYKNPEWQCYEQWIRA